MTSQRTRFVLISLTSAALCGVLTAAPASAADSHCKGLAQAECGTKAGCGWIDAYTRKDGKTVDGYCKKATQPPGVGRDKTPAQMPAQTATDKTTGGTRKRTAQDASATPPPAMTPAADTPKPAVGTGSTPAPTR